MSDITWIWLAFFVGISLRLVDRVEHQIKGPDSAIANVTDYLKAHAWKLPLRLAAGAILLRTAMAAGEVTTALAGLLFGYTAEAALDSLFERASRNGNGTTKG